MWRHREPEVLCERSDPSAVMEMAMGAEACGGVLGRG
jgi:hypothetical protein